MTIRLRTVPRFPARISGSVGITVERDGVDLVVKPDYGALTQVPAVIDPDTSFFAVWQEDDDMYVRMSFDDVFDAVATFGYMQVPVYDPQGIADDAFDRANHTGEQAIATVTGLQTALDGKQALLSGATSDDTFIDTDELVYLTGSSAKRGTLSGLIASIFATARTIANAQFASATFKLFNAAGTPRALTFNTTALTADRVITVPDANVTLATPVLTKEYTSSGQTITSGGSLSLSHGLAAVPKIVTMELVCTTAENGYSIGDVVELYPFNSSSTANVAWGAAVTKNSSTVDVRFSTQNPSFTGINKATGAQVGLTNANWNLVVRAFA